MLLCGDEFRVGGHGDREGRDGQYVARHGWDLSKSGITE